MSVSVKIDMIKRVLDHKLKADHLCELPDPSEYLPESTAYCSDCQTTWIIKTEKQSNNQPLRFFWHASRPYPDYYKFSNYPEKGARHYQEMLEWRCYTNEKPHDHKKRVAATLREQQDEYYRTQAIALREKAQGTQTKPLVHSIPSTPPSDSGESKRSRRKREKYV